MSHDEAVDDRSRKSRTDNAPSTPNLESWLRHLPAGVQKLVSQLMSNWPGRIALRTAAASIRIEVFDRSMTLAAHLFTSVFPVLIMFAVLLGTRYQDEIADAINMPEVSRQVLLQGLSGSSAGTFGFVGAVVVLFSATSLSRALTRALSAVWGLPRPKSRLALAWRWLAVVIATALSVIVLRSVARFADQLPPADVWGTVLTLILDTALAIVVPWLLLAGQVAPRLLLPGAFLFGLAMVVVRPASSVYLPRALQTSDERFGPIGVAFTYITWLYIVSFVFLTAAILGQVISSDQGWLGQRIAGR